MKRNTIDIVISVVIAVALLLLCLYFNLSNKVKVNEMDFIFHDSYTCEQQDTLTIYVVTNMAGDFAYTDSDTNAKYLELVPKNGLGVICDVQNHMDSLTRFWNIPIPGDFTDNEINLPVGQYDSLTVYRTFSFLANIKMAEPPLRLRKDRVVLDEAMIYSIAERLDEDLYTTMFDCSLYPYQDCIHERFGAYSIPGANNLTVFNRNISAMHLKGMKGVNPHKTRLVFLYRTAMDFDVMGLEPDQRRPSMLVYESPEKIRTICEEGLFIYGHSLSNARKIETLNFILAALVGLLVSVLFDFVKRLLETRKQ